MQVLRHFLTFVPTVSKAGQPGARLSLCSVPVATTRSALAGPSISIVRNNNNSNNKTSQSIRTFSRDRSADMAPDTQSFQDATAHRRSYYALSAGSPIPDSEIVAIAETALLNVPSGFNNQATRIAVLVGAAHTKLWTIVRETLMAKIGEERYKGHTEERINGFAAGHGSVLFFDDDATVAALKETIPPTYADKVDDWIHHSSGMHQYYVWVALETHGLGVNLQHYNPIIDARVAREFDIPAHWSLKAQMVFGTPTADPKPKEQKFKTEERLLVRGIGN